MNRIKENRFLFTLKAFWKSFGSYKFRILLLVAVGFMGGLFEGVGINSIIPLFSFVVHTQDQPTDVVSKWTQWIFTTLHIPYELKYLLILIALLFIAKAVTTFLTNYITDRVKTDYTKKTRSDLFKLTIQSSWPYLSKQKIGYLEKVLMTDINMYSALLSYISSSMIVLSGAAIYCFLAFSISPQVMTITLLMGLLFFLIFKPLVYRVRIVSHQSADILKRIANHINESMLGIKTIKAMNLETPVVERGTKYFEELRSIEMKISVLTTLSYVVTQPLSVLLILGLFAFSYKLTAFNFASFAVIVYAINKIFSYIQDGQARIQNINALYPYLRSTIDYERNAYEFREIDGGVSEINFAAPISFENVSFQYSDDQKTLDNISFNIPHGTITGIIGPSGSGKTTLVDLLLQLIRPIQGSISIGDTDVSRIQKHIWRNHVGYVSQDVFLINDTIENNIKLYNPDISHDDMIRATKMANIYDHIMAQPDDFQTSVGERGMELSGGQRQRIALARVLARKPHIIILDEATSALDSESELSIQRAIESLRSTVTVIIIAHRPTMLANADSIIVLKNGTLVEHGAPSVLAQNTDSYYHKLTTQKSS